MKTRELACACCGGTAGRWKQYWNQDTGYGVCAPCVAWMKSKGDTDAQVTDYYGAEGVNWGAQSRKASKFELVDCPGCDGDNPMCPKCGGSGIVASDH